MTEKVEDQFAIKVEYSKDENIFKFLVFGTIAFLFGDIGYNYISNGDDINIIKIGLESLSIIILLYTYWIGRRTALLLEGAYSIGELGIESLSSLLKTVRKNDKGLKRKFIFFSLLKEKISFKK